ncbi:hypothetical protein SAMN04487949_1785 [Halogranum gelatinilyticum]|uniref:Uncharacterized protein n=1 Tax=Halogranum gelatinilyticum TaxID=660521 RepID=A0A1G9TI51_9EURY|nr:hypothetical protein [Halogranum gelatinilyticum]SDM47449.1 hypothetical protein SAMN04487949_1785 [Halogranum gelatinilyticum]
MPSSTARSHTAGFRRLLWGQPRDQRRHWLTFVGGYALALFALFLVALTFDRLLAPVVGATGRLVANVALPVALFYSVPFVSAASAYRGGGLLASVVVALVPSFVFGTVAVADTLLRALSTGAITSQGDAPLWGLLLVYATLGLAGSLVGYLGGLVGRFVVDRYQQ